MSGDIIKIVIVWIIRLSPVWIALLISVNQKEDPKLSKTQLQYRKKMNKLIREGRVRDKYGLPVTKQFDLNNGNKIFGFFVYLIIVILVFIYVNPSLMDVIIAQFSDNAKAYDSQTIEYTAENNTSARTADTIVNSPEKTLEEAINNSRYSEVYSYLRVTDELSDCSKKTSELIKKYFDNQPYTQDEINAVYNHINTIMDSLNNAPEKGDVLKYNSINLAESSKRILEYLYSEKEINGDHTYLKQINEEIVKRNIYIEQQEDLIKGLLGAYEIPYTDEISGIRYTIID